MSNYQKSLKRLNEHQRAVVFHGEGPALTLSSAGAGKSSTLVTRIAHLIEKEGVSPNSILAITFTKKAAEEMQEKLSKLLDKDTVKRVKVGTIHSFSRMVYIKTNEAMDPSFVTPDPFVARSGEFWPIFMASATKGAVKWKNVFLDQYQSAVSALKRDLKTIQDYAKENDLMDGNELKLRKDSKSYDWPSSVVLFEALYEKWKRVNHVIDFDDMLVYTLKILQDPRQRKYIDPYLRKFEHILVDESQDTTFVSFQILDELIKYTPNVVLVGDIRQSIFSFAGARIKNIHDFIAKYKPAVYDLKINYRSTETIVSNSNKFIASAKGVIGAPAVANNTSTDTPIELFVAFDEIDEASRIADRIESLISGGVEPENIAVIYRVHSQAMAIEDQMHSRGIPYYSYSKQAFFLRKEVKDILAYMKIIGAPSKAKKSDLERIVNKPNRFLPKQVATEVFQTKKENKCSIISAMEICDTLDGWVLQNLNKLRYDLLRAVDKTQRISHVGEMVEFILNDLGYLQYVKDSQANAGAEADWDPLSNFDAIISTAKRFKTIPEFLEHIEALSEQDSKDKSEDDNLVKLMTIHMSKGKEWDHVFVAGFCDRFYPIYRAATDEEFEEERRISYVAITRPKQQLHISSIFGKYGRFKVSVSNYLRMMEVDLDYELSKFQTEAGVIYGKETEI